MPGMGYQITVTVGYGIQACTDLARSDGPISASVLADSACVSASYMGQVLNRLRAGGVVKSRGGVQGGYRLSRPVSKVTAGQIIEALLGPPPEIPSNIPPKIRRQLKQASRELYAIRLSEL